ncbi:carboxymuconolactone decarboxylase family protein [Xanthocytophaga agilis]|uniref:Carboxymuconolactone decarboxylase family protein n=1 Tax=Xanthocytophaga agilis TaxID=3048010 RepID=A0AAE3R0G5_9BACT|nr:carboxymuconolactone decarboxylase family protein [Xanthocytophaga agilis]MDJ1499429.1 carboxymuconolactone decarboxylase family protein [Xanthocytophaga agilis]
MKTRISFQEAPKGFMDGLMKTHLYLKKSGLDAKLIELINFRVSQINECAYCLDMHYKDAIQLGESEQRLYSLATWRETPYYSKAERAALAYTESLTRLNNHESAEKEWEELSIYFSTTDIANLTLAITQINTWNRLNRAFGTVPGNYQPGEHEVAPAVAV